MKNIFSLWFFHRFHVSLYKLKIVRMIFKKHEEKLVMKAPKEKASLFLLLYFSNDYIAFLC
jgi:hypothetical protein